MQKQMVKQMIQSTAALTLFTAMLIGMPFPKTPVPDGNGHGGKPSITIVVPDGEGDHGSWTEPGIRPMSDLPPLVDRIDNPA